MGAQGAVITTSALSGPGERLAWRLETRKEMPETELQNQLPLLPSLWWKQQEGHLTEGLESNGWHLWKEVAQDCLRRGIIST